jgi:hypothetical protein
MSRAARRTVNVTGAALCAALIACGGGSAPQTAPTPAALPIDSVAFAPSLGIDLRLFTKLRSGAWYFDALRGSGAIADVGQVLTMKYVASLPNGTVVDAQTTPVDIRLDDRVFRGWRSAIPGMRGGGKRTIILPPELAYGASGQGNVPPNSTLVFKIELISVR